MDDILIVHNLDTSTVSNILNKVYNNILQLDITHLDDNRCNYLDLHIRVEDDKVYTKMYNKTDTFSFKVLKLPHYNSFISSKVKKATIYAEILRIARTCVFFEDFKVRFNHLSKDVIESGYNTHDIHKIFCKCVYRNIFIAYKYGLYVHKGAPDLISSVQD